jgi:hypothetical protein
MRVSEKLHVLLALALRRKRPWRPENKTLNGGFWDKMNGASGYIEMEGDFLFLSASEKWLWSFVLYIGRRSA